jgi:hypothetical protein
MTSGREDGYGEIVAGPYRPELRRPGSVAAALGGIAALFLGLGWFFVGGAMNGPRVIPLGNAGRERFHPVFYLVVGAGALLFAGFVLFKMWSGRRDRVELRRDGVVRISRQFGVLRGR